MPEARERMQEETEIREALRVENLTKTFPGGVVADDNVSITVREGEVHGLLGENGAGKTVLMSCVSGIYPPDSGRIYLWSSQVEITSPQIAARLGIGMVHQTFRLIRPFTVIQNVVLGVKPWKSWVRPERNLRKAVTELARRHGFQLDLDAKIEDLSGGEQQSVEILKVLYRGARILILDEPTSVLTSHQATQLMRNLRRMIAQGMTIVFITHKFDEVKDFTDRVTVLRKGKVVSTAKTADVNIRDLTRMVVGRDVTLQVQKPQVSLRKREVILEVEDLKIMGNRGEAAVDGVTFKLYQGEILAIAGVSGNGQEELAEALYGLRRIKDGRMRLFGQDVTKESTAKLREKGMRMIPADRMFALTPTLPIWESVGVEAMDRPGFSRYGLIKWNSVRGYASQLMDRFSVRGAGMKSLIRHVSGGNQQKILVGMVISSNPKVLIVSQPTMGLDVASTEYVRRKLVECRSRGMAILLFSTDLDEVLSISDRVGIMFKGRLQKTLLSEEAEREAVGAMMMGAASD